MDDTPRTLRPEPRPMPGKRERPPAPPTPRFVLVWTGLLFAVTIVCLCALMVAWTYERVTG